MPRSTDKDPDIDRNRQGAKIVGILGLPRSGTTVVTAVLDVNSSVYSVYEPWNANMGRIDFESPMNYGQFSSLFLSSMPSSATVVLKETATRIDYINRMVEVISTAPVQNREILLIIRNPFHVFLSEMQARRQWWGEADLAINADSFSKWARRTLHALSVMAKVVRRYDGLLLSYEAFTSEPSRGVEDVTRALGLEPESAQFAFEKYLDKTRVRGDNHVALAPESLGDRSTIRRETEFKELRGELQKSDLFERIELFAERHRAIPMLSRGRDQAQFIESMLNAN